MIRHPMAVALLAILVVTACDAPAITPSPSPLAAVEPSASAGSPVPSSTPVSSATPLATATPLPTPTASPTPASTPEPWQAYTSKRFHYKIKYPPNWVVTPGSAKIADQFDFYAYPYAYVSRDVRPTGTVSLSLTATHEIAYYKSHYKAKVVLNKSVKVAGWPGRLLIFSGLDDGFMMQFQVLILARGRVAYFISMDGFFGAGKADKALFKKMYSTFKPT